MTEYHVITGTLDDEHCGIYDQNPSLADFTWPALGRRMGERWPDGLEYTMSADEPGRAVADVINNTLGYLMVSARIKALLAEQAAAEIEWLRFVLREPGGRVASDDLWVANVLSVVECVDRERTDGSPHPARPGRYFSIYRLELDRQRIDPALNLFRLAEMPEVIIVRDDLRQALEALGVSGVAFHGMGEDVEL